MPIPKPPYPAEFRRQMDATYPSRKFVLPRVRLMIEFLVNAFRMRAWPA